MASSSILVPVISAIAGGIAAVSADHALQTLRVQAKTNDLNHLADIVRFNHAKIIDGEKNILKIIGFQIWKKVLYKGMFCFKT